MNYTKLKSLRLWDRVDKQIMKKGFAGARRDSLYPSEASVVAIDPKTKEATIFGGCKRKSWYRFFKFEKTEPITVKTQYTFSFGNMIETFIVDLIKKTGLYNNNSVKFFDKSTGVSGELDVVLDLPVSDDGEIIFCEIKSTWGGKLSKMINPETHEKELFESGANKNLFRHLEGLGKTRHIVQGTPKEGNLLQLVTYLFIHRDNENLVGGKLVYMLRDNFNRTEFDVDLRLNEKTQKHDIYVNGIKEPRFCADDVYDRFKELGAMFNADVKRIRGGEKIEDLAPPERDYELEYSDEKVERLYKAGKLSKSKYEKHNKGFKTGDWNCSYCDFRSLCYSKAQENKIAA